MERVKKEYEEKQRKKKEEKDKKEKDKNKDKKDEKDKDGKSDDDKKDDKTEVGPPSGVIQVATDCWQGKEETKSPAPEAEEEPRVFELKRLTPAPAAVGCNVADAAAAPFTNND